MKKAKDDKRISTIPDGVYEAGVVGHGPSHDKNSHENTPSTDAQGNGYPMHEAKTGQADNWPVLYINSISPLNIRKTS